MPLTHGDRASWLEEIWKALEDWREAHPEGDALRDAQWDEICTAMAWIGEDLDVTGSL
ncbi:hypothetical protein UFOVP266_25 [uncultured Caudovirales phage]|uniref:Uncharacterized protein n=1 Tax=uncultured Caudovirales phage TaxID=2100421 RepID=A0A6J5LMJ5_9CAUD|nr:hypothetical protein UFOVP266_25 [uncultured Caudovirales phage]